MLKTSASNTARLLLVFLCFSGTCTAGEDIIWSALRVSPETVYLAAPEATDQILVTATDALNRQIDVTRQVQFVLSDPNIADVSGTGVIVPKRDGDVALNVTLGALTVQCRVQVSGVDQPSPVSFREEIIPLLSKSGCNSGGCHGKAEGQNGFRLSVFGFDPAIDYDAIVRDGRGRRVFPAAPEKSLLIQKAVSAVPHGGGRRIEPNSRWHRLLLRWVAEGMALDGPDVDPVEKITVEPLDVVLDPRGTQQVRVLAITRSGATRTVTTEADFQSNNDVIAVIGREGLIQATDVPGEAAMLIRYMGHVAVSRVTLPGPAVQFVRPPENNFIDGLVWDKLQKLQILPSDIASDSTFLRRVYLDVIGTLPTPEESRSFLVDSDPGKRAKLIDALLERPEYADFWAQHWADLLQADKDIITPQGTVAVTRWVHDQLERNVAFDQFVREVLTAQGATTGHSPAAFFQVQVDAEKAARAVSQLFLGVRIECAQCHHHPFERWDQKDYFALAGFFTGMDKKALPNGSMKIVNKPGEDVKHPRTGEVIPTAALGAPVAVFTDPKGRRDVLANWVASSENHMFVRTVVNRMVAHYFGRGLVEPVDDLRATNPAANEQLMEALADHLVEIRFDLKALTRTLLNSRVYQLSSSVNATNRLDDQNYSHASVKPLPAEVLLDALSQATAVPERFNGWPDGYRAIQVWDNKLPSLFLETFGRPIRQSVCACDRGTEPSMAQALHLMNSETTAVKLEDRRSRAARLAESEASLDQIVEELYLATLSRYPSDEEQLLMQNALSTAQDRTHAVEDVLWTILNTREFVFNH